jgi:predicted nuclease of predicted toxin-antitoxin system
MRGAAAAAAVPAKFKLGENLPASSAAVLASAGHDAGTVSNEGMTGAPDQDIIAAATSAGRILISLDVGMADIRATSPAATRASSCCAEWYRRA